MSTRLLIVGWDAAEPELVNQWAEEGLLPNLSQLRARGSDAEIRNYPGFGNGVFWPSITTGSDPSHHGRYFRRQPQPPEFEFDIFRERYFKRVPFWKDLEDEGLLVGVIDPVESPAGALSKGVEVLEWLTHGRIEDPRSSPPDLVDRLKQNYGDDPFEGNTDSKMQDGLAMQEFLSGIEQRVATKTTAAIELLKERDWDVFFVTYHDTHDIGHIAWHLHEQYGGEGLSDSAGGQGDADPVRNLYRLLDAQLLKLQEFLATGGETILLMGPGIESNVSGNHLLPEVLRGFQQKPRSWPTRMLSQMSKTIIRSGALSMGAKKRFKSVRSRAGAKFQGATGRPYFSVPHNANAGAIRINLKGRDVHGVIEPGPAYERLCAELSDKLMRLRDASGEKPLVREVVHTHKLFSGPELDTLPDLMVIWNRFADTSSTSSPDIGVVRASNMSIRTGDHTDRGLVIGGNPPSMPEGTPLAPDQVTPHLMAVARRVAMAP